MWGVQQTHVVLVAGTGTDRYLLRSTRPFFLELHTRYIGVLYYYHRPIVLYYPLLGATLKLGRWLPPLGPPTDLMPGHLSPACGLTTLNAPHLRVGQSRCSSSFRELGISIVHLGATVHARPIACMAPFSGWQAASWLG